MPATSYTSASVEEQWHALAGPWLWEHATTAGRIPKPTVILTPSRAEGFYLRSRLVEENVPFLGLRFWTPSDARKYLLAVLLPEVNSATQAELRLLARTCAEKWASTVAGNATLASVVRDPNAFLRAYDLLLGAGWDPAEEGAIYGRQLAREFQAALKRHEIATQAGLHRQLWQKSSSLDERPLANLLVAGFNAAHWPLWDLLKAAVLSADNAVISLLNPRGFAERIDQLWQGSWEEFTQASALPAGPVAHAEPRSPFAGLVAAYERGAREADAKSRATPLSFLSTPDLATQIRAVVLQTLAYLKDRSCKRLGILFPEVNALALGVAEELRRLSIPLDDGTGAWTPGAFEQSCWQTWIALQEEPGVPRLIAWLRACEAHDVSFGATISQSAREIADVVDGALGETLVDDLDFLAVYLEENTLGGKKCAVGEFLRKRVVLPDEATFARFLELTQRAVTFPGWEEHLERLQVAPPAWLSKAGSPMSRRTFLEWLGDSTRSQSRTRGRDGNHFYGKVHLGIYAQMTGQTWTHLILTGLNEGVWPRVYEAGAFGSRHELAALNQRVRELNPRSEGQGGQGEGHETVRPGHGHCLLPLERQELALRDLCAALESTSVAASLTAMTTEGGRSLLPSDFFNHAYQFHTGRMLDEEAFRHLARVTGEWCGQHEASLAHFPGSSGESSLEDLPLFADASLHATRIAYDARRDSGRAFGTYEFAFARPPDQPIQLNCKEWDDAWHHPATTWLGKIVGASSCPDGTLSWPRAIGTWVHRWLAAALRECHERESPAEFPILLRAAADQYAHGVRHRAQDAGLELYPWWDQVWRHARTIALGLADALAVRLQSRQFLSEYTLPRGLVIALPGAAEADFALKGRLDLLLITPGSAMHDIEHGNFSGCDCWVVDFKTGSADSLKNKRLEKGDGLQPLLYALAVRARDAATIAVSLQTFDTVLKPQVQLDDLMPFAPLLRSLDKFHRDGIFGMRPDADNDYGYSPAYPMATRFIAADILDAKWELVHGGEIPAEEDAP